MKRQDENFSDYDSDIQLEKNISRLLMLADDTGQPGRMFIDRLINNALAELGRAETNSEREQKKTVVTISQLEKVAAMVAVGCGAGFSVLFNVLANVSSLSTGIILIVMFVNRLIYYGGLIL